MKWYRDRLILCLLAVLVSVVVLPIRWFGGLLVFIGEKIQRVDDRIINTRLIRRIDKFADRHETDTNKRGK